MSDRFCRDGFSEMDKTFLQGLSDEAIEVFNVSRSHNPASKPCTCSVCIAIMGKIEMWFRKRKAK